MNNHKPVKSSQKGAALLLFVASLIVIVAILSYALLGELTQHLKRQQAQEVGALLAEAKESLLMFAEHIPEAYAQSASEKSPGFFLCPDMNALTSPLSGYSSGSCSWKTENAIGRLPSSKSASGSMAEYVYFWSGEKSTGVSLWYAIADEYRYGATGNLSIYGNWINPVYGSGGSLTPSMRFDNEPVVSVIIAAGEALSHQRGRDVTKSASSQWQHFLESPSAGASTGVFLSRSDQSSRAFNDRVLAITHTEFQERMKQKVCSLAKQNQWCSSLENNCSGSCVTGICRTNGACHFSGLAASHWFKRFKWSDSQGNGMGVARICNISLGQVNGMNISECP